MSTKDGKTIPTPVICLILLGVGLLAGWPSIHGGFLSGDDYHLVRSHVLVNHPSFAHAVKLFTIVHRDLYQPIPLLSFQIDFAIIKQLGLLPIPEGRQAGAWVFHFTNILLHALNAVLVFFVVKRLSRDATASFVAAILFACHPLAGEPIGWLNGRMMMLSTLFTLSSLVAFDRFSDRRTLARAGLVLILVLSAHMSKVSLSIPFLLLIFPLVRRRWPVRSWWLMWGVVTAVTISFAVLNIYTSGEMFTRAEDEMSGPPIVNVVLALGQYFRHFVAPVGLSPWYPPSDGVGFGDPTFLTALVTVLMVGALVLGCVRRTWVPVLALVWFMVAVGPTLPFFPARRALAADRYVYLPNVGLCWLAGVGIVWAVGRLTKNALAARRGALAIALAVSACLLVGLWHALEFYHDNIASADRIAICFPDEPGVYEAAAWARYRQGQYEDAIDVAIRDLEHHRDEMGHKVFQVVGMSQFRLGRIDDAIETLRAAVAHKPDYGKCYSRLAQVLAAAGRTIEAIENYERAAEIMPFYNPGLLPLADMYRNEGQPTRARAIYRQVLRNNAYDVRAHLALAEMDMGDGQHQKAADRLVELLSWMPENSVARTNLAVALDRMGDTSGAVGHYNRAIRDDPHNMTAYLNLANVYHRAGDVSRADRVYGQGLKQFEQNLVYQIAYHDFAVTIGRPTLSAEALSRVLSDDDGWTAWRTYAQVQSCTTGSHDASMDCPCPVDSVSEPYADLFRLSRVLCALRNHDAESTVTTVSSLLDTSRLDPPDALERLLGDMERFASAHPENPWPFYVTAMVLRHQGRADVATMAIAAFDELCDGEQCAKYRQRLGMN